MRTRLIQIVPHLPPATSGVGDYALILGRGLCRRGWRTTYVAVNERCDRRLEGYDVVGLTEGDRASALVGTLERCGAAVVLLHYSGYGYARRGAPLWLTRGLRRWKRGAARPWLVVMFHEMWASGPPWRSSFWLSPLQQRVVRDLVDLTDSLLTNIEVHAAQLASIARPRCPDTVLPVLSNIGEPRCIPSFASRELVAVVLGQRGTRERVYAQIADFVQVLAGAGIERLLDIGPPLDHGSIPRCSIPIEQLGYLDADAASKIMCRSRYGLLDYPLVCAAKSGVLAAYAAHGLVPVVRSGTDGEHDGLRHGLNLVRIGAARSPLRDGAAEQIAAAAHSWYQQHALERTVHAFAEAISPFEQAR